MRNLIQTNNPELLLLFYENGAIESRKINDKGEVGPAKKLYQKTINKLFSHLKGEVTDWSFKGLIPNNVLYVNNKKEVIIWTVEAQIKTLKYKGSKDQTHALPRLIFKINGESLKIIACKDFKTSSTAYLPPFSNMHGSYTVCLGSASLKLDGFKYYEDIIEYVEHQFYSSKFTSSSGAYQDLGKNKKKFPVSKLKKFRKDITIKDFIND